jgi:hypothetical protein
MHSYYAIIRQGKNGENREYSVTDVDWAATDTQQLQNKFITRYHEYKRFGSTRMVQIKTVELKRKMFIHAFDKTVIYFST